MIRINENYTKLKASYLFADIARRVNAYVAANPDKPIIRLGIGDVTEPLPKVCLDALHAATDEMGQRATFKGYGPEQGYAFLREAIAQHDYTARGCKIEADEIFISDGSKCDCGNIQEIFSSEARLAIPDPVYPVYVDTNVMAGRTGANVDGRYQGITYLDSTPANGYVPAVPGVQPQVAPRFDRALRHPDVPRPDEVRAAWPHADLTGGADRHLVVVVVEDGHVVVRADPAARAGLVVVVHPSEEW